MGTNSAISDVMVTNPESMPPINQPFHERRSFDLPASFPHLGEGETSRSIHGLAIVYEAESEVMYDWWEDRSFVEIVHRGAVTEDLLKTSDILALYEHDRSKLLARSSQGEGTLQLTITDEGLHYRFDAPATQLGDDTLELLRRGDLRSSSFLFGVKTGDTRWEQKRDGTWIRHIDHFSFLGDVSVVSLPAYPASNASAERSRQTLTEERSHFLSQVESGLSPEEQKAKEEVRHLSPLEVRALRRADLLSNH